MMEKGKLNKKTILLIAGLIAYLAVHFAFMYTDKVVDVTEKQTVPIEFQAYAPGLPEGTDVEETVVCTGDPVYGVISEQMTLRSGQTRMKSDIKEFYVFIPCQTSSGESLWIGGKKRMNTTQAVNYRATATEFRESVRSLVPEDGSAFTVRGRISSLDPKASIVPDKDYYAPLAISIDPERNEQVQKAISEALAAGQYIEVFTDFHDTRAVDVVVGQETRRVFSSAFSYMLIADVVLAIVLAKRFLFGKPKGR